MSAASARALLAFLLTLATAARVVGVRTAEARAAAVVERQVVCLEGVSPAAEAAIRELVARLGLRATTGVAAADETLARVQVTEDGHGVVVRIFDGHGRERATQRLEGEASIVDEELAHVVQGAVEELERTEAPAARPPGTAAAAPPEPAPAAVAVSAGVFGAALAFADGATGGAGLDISFKFGNVRFVTEGSLWAPVTRRSSGDGDVRSEIALRTGHVSALVMLAERGRFAVAAGPSVGVGWVGAHTEASSIDPSRVAEQRAATSILVGVRGTGYAALGRNLSMFLSILGDVDTSPHRVVQDTGAGRTTLFATGTFRPAATLGLEVHFDAGRDARGR